MAEIYLDIYEDAFEKSKKKARETAIKDMDEDTNSFVYSNENLELDEVTFESGELKISGSFGIGYTSIAFDIDLDLAAEIIDFYIKKLNKLKTVLEATK